MEEVVDVPSHFLCPISLQLMSDPITISTGITYDRENIERWIFSCRNNTCPVTNQILSNADLIPNHTLLRLIQSWCTLNAPHRIGCIQSPKQLMDKIQLSNLLNEAKTFPDTKLKCLRKLEAIALQKEKWKNRLVEDVGGVEFLACIIMSEFSRSCDEALYILCQFEPSAKALKDLVRENVEFIDSLQQIMRCGESQSRVYATELMNSIFEVADPIQLISVRSDLFIEIVHILRDNISYRSIKSSLKLLTKLCPWGRNRIKAVGSNAVTALIEVLLDISDRRVCELAMTVLDQLCSCADGREEFLSHGAGLAIVSKKILRVSHVETDRAVRVLSSISKFSATPVVLQEMIQVGVVSKLCVVLQSECSSKARERCRAMLKLHSRVWRSSPCLPDHLLSSYPSSDL